MCYHHTCYFYFSYPHNLFMKHKPLAHIVHIFRDPLMTLWSVDECTFCLSACVCVCSRNAFWQFSPWSKKRQKSYLFSSFGIEAPKGANGSEVELKMWRQRWIGVTSTQQKFGSCKNLLYSIIPNVFTVPAKSARVGFEIHKRLRLSVLVRVVILY